MSNPNGQLNRSLECESSAFNGYLMIAVALLLFVALFFLSVSALASDSLGSAAVGVLVSLFALIMTLSGFYMLQPNQAAAITLFGSYRGTDRNEGLRWVLPWMGRNRISVRASNLISEQIKVNDLRGNPIEIAAQVVWRVTDTAQALFDIDDYKAFVAAQIEAAIRSIGSRYPYDDIEHKEITLRGNREEVGAELQIALTER